MISLSLAYSVFCFICWGKVNNVIESTHMGDIVNQNGFDLTRLPIPIDRMISLACLIGVIFNLFTALWVYKRWNFWKWCICSAVSFCIICGSVGPLYGLSPLYSLFGGCCAFMLLVGWVLGLSYIQFCVIGNIWIPIAAVILSAVYMAFRVLSTKECPSFVRFFAMGLCIIESVGSILIGIHYTLPMRDAFYLCVTDLKHIAEMFHTTYVAVNLVIYVVGIPILLTSNIAFTRKYCIKRNKQSLNQNETYLKKTI